ncbi:MAG: hypothetical protein J3K34DRAFT_518154 [Monoraphidium minutum]|nr:MAG: hypothetical protein J3K34DRAFT_518154 [Monoraphidium minutum]
MEDDLWAPIGGSLGVPGLPHDKVMAEYIYIAGGIELQSQTVVLDGGRPASAAALPAVEAQGERGEIYLVPRSIYADPLRGGDHVLVLCEVHAPPQLAAGELHPRPHASNMRAPAAELAAAAAPARPELAAEQEYAVLDPFTGLPPGVLPAGVPAYVPGAQHPQHAPGTSWCESASAWGSPASGGGGDGLSMACSGGGAERALAASLSSLPGGAATAAHLLLGDGGPPAAPYGSPGARRGRQLAELHMRACIRAGLRYAGGAPAAPPHAPACGARGGGGGGCYASYRLGPCGCAPEMGDQIAVSRFLLSRLGEDLGLRVDFGGGGGCAGFNGGGAPPPACSLEFSAAPTRAGAPDAMGELQRALARLQAAHPRHGGALARSAGAPFAPFTVAVAERRASVTIPTSTLVARGGPFVDRRAAAGADPYLATTLLTAGALGLAVPAAAERAAAAAAPAALAWPRAWGAGVPPAFGGAPPAALSPSDAAHLLLKHHQQAAAAAAAAGAGGLAAALSAALAAASGPPRRGCSAGSALSGGADSGACSDDSDAEGSADMLVSEIRRMDRMARRAARGKGAAPSGGAFAGAGAGEGLDLDLDLDLEEEDDDFDSEGEEDDSASSAVATPAGSPAGGMLAAACAGDEDMLMA